MKGPRRAKIRFEMTREQALQRDLLACACGHRENNHFDLPGEVVAGWDRNPCAHCDCKEYRERPLVGRLLP